MSNAKANKLVSGLDGEFAGEAIVKDDPLQYLSDYVAIRQLNARYNRYADLADGESYSNLYTEDAEVNIVGEGIYVGREQQSFGEFIAGWPDDDVIGLWLYLKKQGSRLGGNTGPFALRTLGVDTFLLTQDVEGFLRSHDIVDSGITSQRALKAAQTYFNDLREQSGKSLAELSRLVSFCHGQNRSV